MELLRLKELLNEKNITGKDLAERVGVNPNTISRIIKGSSFPSGELLKRISEELGVSVKELFNPGENEEAIYIKKNGNYIKIGEINSGHFE